MTERSNDHKVRTEVLEGGAVWRVTLDSPKGNVLDGVMVLELIGVFESATDAKGLKAIVLAAAGEHFCFGASIQEHQADQVAGMLERFHRLFRTIAAAGVPVVAAVRGMCLGGGLELVAFCQRVFGHMDSAYAQPEILLGVFAPVGSVILAERVGRSGAEDLLLTGRTVQAEEARAMGLVDEVCADPEAGALAWVRQDLLSKSASSLRLACKAARHGFHQRFDREIEQLERFYLDTLMETRDANEGIAAFLEKRAPEWSDD